MIRLKSLLEDAQDDVRDLIQSSDTSYADFVKQLDQLASDPKVNAFLTAGLKDGSLHDDEIKVSQESIPVKDLIPTQSEIDIDKSLYHICTNPANIKEAFQSSATFGGQSIISLNKKYIIDGHHRWSQGYIINANCHLAAINFNIDIEPVEMLKKMQISIAASVKKIPTSHVNGINLLTTSGNSIVKYMMDTLTEECAQLFNTYYKTSYKNKKDIILRIIWPNIKLMRQNNKPIADAPDRNLMPQISKAPTSLKNLIKGIININEPFGQTA